MNFLCNNKKHLFCDISEEGCQTLFEESGGHSCFEFVSSAAVTWHEALDSCRSQGADLLSFSKLSDFQSMTCETDLPHVYVCSVEREQVGAKALDFLLTVMLDLVSTKFHTGLFWEMNGASQKPIKMM